MADFKSHITASTIVGAGYGYWGYAHQGMPLEGALVAAGLCSVSGMMPDLDSNSGVPVREATMFSSAVVPMLMINRFRDFDLSPEAMVLAAGLIYLVLRFIVAEVFKRYTVHRGMWHSIPAAVSAGLLAYLLMPGMSEGARIYKSTAVVLGFVSHLVLDEIWSVQYRYGRFRLKKSFGTALKFWGPSFAGNFSTYGKLAILVWLAYNDAGVLQRVRNSEYQFSIQRTSDAEISPPLEETLAPRE